MEELESGEMRAICSSEGKEYIYKVSAVIIVGLTSPIPVASLTKVESRSTTRTTSVCGSVH